MALVTLKETNTNMAGEKNVVVKSVLASNTSDTILMSTYNFEFADIVEVKWSGDTRIERNGVELINVIRNGAWDFTGDGYTLNEENTSDITISSDGNWDSTVILELRGKEV